MLNKLGKFGDHTSRYPTTIVERKVAEFEARLINSIEDLLRMSLDNYRRLAINRFHEFFLSNSSVIFSQRLKGAIEAAENLFNQGIKGTLYYHR